MTHSIHNTINNLIAYHNVHHGKIPQLSSNPPISIVCVCCGENVSTDAFFFTCNMKYRKMIGFYWGLNNTRKPHTIHGECMAKHVIAYRSQHMGPIPCPECRSHVHSDHLLTFLSDRCLICHLPCTDPNLRQEWACRHMFHITCSSSNTVVCPLADRHRPCIDDTHTLELVAKLRLNSAPRNTSRQGVYIYNSGNFTSYLALNQIWEIIRSPDLQYGSDICVVCSNAIQIVPQFLYTCGHRYNVCVEHMYSTIILATRLPQSQGVVCATCGKATSGILLDGMRTCGVQGALGELNGWIMGMTLVLWRQGPES